MALGFSLLATHADTSNLTTHTDAETTQPAANSALLWFIRHAVAGGGVVPTSVSAYGATWNLVGSDIQGTGGRLIVYEAYAGGSPSSSTASVTWSGGSTGCIFDIVEITGADQTDFTVQAVFAKGTGATSSSVTLSAFGDSTNNGAVAASIIHVNSAITPDGTATWTELADHGHNSPTSRMQVQCRTGEDTTVTSSWTGSEDWVAVAIEVKMATSSGATATPAVIATTIAVPTTAAGVGAVPGVVATSVALPTAAVSVGAVPPKITTTVAIPTAAVSVAAIPAVTVTTVTVPSIVKPDTVTPATVATVVALPTAAVSVAAVPPVTATTITLPAPLVGVGAVPAVTVTVVAVPVPTAGELGGGSATATPAVIATSVTLPTAAAGVGAVPSVVATLVALPTAAAGVGAVPSTVATTVALPTAGAGVGAVPSVIATTTTLPTAGAGVGGAPSAIATTVTMPTAAVGVGAVPTTIVTLISVPMPTAATSEVTWLNLEASFAHMGTVTAELPGIESVGAALPHALGNEG